MRKRKRRSSNWFPGEYEASIIWGSFLVISCYMLYTCVYSMIYSIYGSTSVMRGEIERYLENIEKALLSSADEFIFFI